MIVYFYRRLGFGLLVGFYRWCNFYFYVFFFYVIFGVVAF